MNKARSRQNKSGQCDVLTACTAVIKNNEFKSDKGKHKDAPASEGNRKETPKGGIFTFLSENAVNLEQSILLARKRDFAWAAERCDKSSSWGHIDMPGNLSWMRELTAHDSLTSDFADAEM